MDVYFKVTGSSRFSFLWPRFTIFAFLLLVCNNNKQAVQEYSRRRLPPTAQSPSGDAVLITKADLEGYHSACDDETVHKELAVVPKIKGRPMMAMLSCLFASLKVSGVSGPVTSRLPEARACWAPESFMNVVRLSCCKQKLHEISMEFSH